MTDRPVRVLATFEPARDADTAVLDVLREVASHTRQEPGNEQFELYRSRTDGRTRFHLVERFADVEAVEAHRASAHYRRYREAIADLLANPVDVAVLEPADEPDADHG